MSNQIVRTPVNEIKSMITDGFSKRLRSAIGDEKDVSISAFAKKCGFGESLLRKYLKGESLPGIENAAALAVAAGVSLDWLIAARGPMYPSDWSEAYPDSSYRADEGWITFPIYSARAAAGHGSINEPGLPTPGVAFDPELSSYLFHAPNNALAGLYVTGDSMEPTFSDGDVLIIDLSVKAVIGDAIYVLVVDEGCVVKRIAPRTNGSLSLLSDNPSYLPEEVTSAQKQYLRIYGRVVAALRRL